MVLGHKKRLDDMCWADSKFCKCCQAEGTEKKNGMTSARSCEMQAQQSEEDWKWHGRCVWWFDTMEKVISMMVL